MSYHALAAAVVVATSAVLGSPTSASAQSYPERSVRMIIAFPAGGTIDTLGRIVAQKLTEAWGQNVVVENRAGASGNIGAQAAAQAAPDGYTLHLGAQTLAVNVTSVGRSAAGSHSTSNRVKVPPFPFSSVVVCRRTRSVCSVTGMRMFSCRASMLSNRQRSTEVARSENNAKLTPLPSQVAPSGYG